MNALIGSKRRSHILNEMTCGYREFIEMVLAWRIHWLWQLVGLAILILTVSIAGGMLLFAFLSYKVLGWNL